MEEEDTAPVFKDASLDCGGDKRPLVRPKREYWAVFGQGDLDNEIFGSGDQEKISLSELGPQALHQGQKGGPIRVEIKSACGAWSASCEEVVVAALKGVGQQPEAKKEEGETEGGASSPGEDAKEVQSALEAQTSENGQWNEGIKEVTDAPMVGDAC